MLKKMYKDVIEQGSLEDVSNDLFRDYLKNNKVAILSEGSLIDMDYEIVFCKQRDICTRVFWFYARKDSALQSFIAKWGNSWINLFDNQLGTPLAIELFENEYC